MLKVLAVLAGVAATVATDAFLPASASVLALVPGVLVGAVLWDAARRRAGALH